MEVSVAWMEVEVMAANSFNKNREQQDVDLSSVPARVEKVHFDGLTRTKDDFLVKQVKEIFKADNFEEMVRRAETARLSMEKLGLFRKVGVLIDVAKASADKAANPNGYEIHYIVQERRRVGGGISTMIGTNDGSVLFQIRLPNTFGRAEKFNLEYQHGTKSTTGFGASFVKPVGGNPTVLASLGASKHTGDFPWSGYTEKDHGVNAELSFPSIFGSHNIRWEGVWRDLTCSSRTTAFAVREQAGHSVKSSLQHTWVRDRRDDRILPSSGYLLKVNQELAGLGGDTKFVKHEVEFQTNKSLILDSVLQLTLAGGIVKSLEPDGRMRIMDNFFLGGPLTLRGFNLKGVGPAEDGSSLGADTFWQAGLHFYTPLPFRPGKGGFGELFRTHFFVNAGNLRNIDYTDLHEKWRDNIKLLGETLRLSYGAGIVLRMGGIARLELNYCVPYKMLQGDSINPGLQFGIGLNFL